MSIRELARVVSVVLLVLAAPLGAHAAEKSVALATPHSGSRQVSYSTWVIEGSTIRLRVMLPKAAADAIAEPGKPPPRINEVADYVHAQFTARSAGGACKLIDQGEGFGEVYTMALTPGIYRYELIFNCTSTEGVTLGDSLLVLRVPTHVNYARVQVNGGNPWLGMFDRTHQTLQAAGSKAGTPPALFARQGALKLVRDLDRLCVLAGLLLLAMAWEDLAAIVAGLVVGYALSLVAALARVAVLDPAIGEGAVMLLIVLLGGAAIRSHVGGLPLSRRARIGTAITLGLVIAAATGAAFLKGATLGLTVGGLGLAGLAFLWLAGPQRPRWLLAAPAGLFAFISGMSQASDLDLLRLPGRALGPVLAAHDLGAAGAAVAIATAASILVWLGFRKLLPLRNPLGETAGAGLIGLGVFWFVTALVS